MSITLPSQGFFRNFILILAGAIVAAILGVFGLTTTEFCNEIGACDARTILEDDCEKVIPGFIPINPVDFSAYSDEDLTTPLGTWRFNHTGQLFKIADDGTITEVMSFESRDNDSIRIDVTWWKAIPDSSGYELINTDTGEIVYLKE